MIIKIHKKPIELHKGIAIPDNLVKEMDDFVIRNALVDLGLSDRPEGVKSKCRYRCCNRCLKAFSLERAKEMKLGLESIDLLDALFDCEVGHDGYYLDSGNLTDCKFSLHADN